MAIGYTSLNHGSQFRSLAASNVSTTLASFESILLGLWRALTVTATWLPSDPPAISHRRSLFWNPFLNCVRIQSPLKFFPEGEGGLGSVFQSASRIFHCESLAKFPTIFVFGVKDRHFFLVVYQQLGMRPTLCILWAAVFFSSVTCGVIKSFSSCSVNFWKRWMSDLEDPGYWSYCGGHFVSYRLIR